MEAAGAGQAQIFVDDDGLLFGPAELTGALSKSVLTGSGFAIIFDLGWRGLAQVNERGAFEMRNSDFGKVSRH